MAMRRRTKEGGGGEEDADDDSDNNVDADDDNHDDDSGGGCKMKPLQLMVLAMMILTRGLLELFSCVFVTCLSLLFLKMF